LVFNLGILGKDVKPKGGESAVSACKGAIILQREDKTLAAWLRCCEEEEGEEEEEEEIKKDNRRDTRLFGLQHELRMAESSGSVLNFSKSCEKKSEQDPDSSSSPLELQTPERRELRRSCSRRKAAS
jgi:hypothetical protein